MSELRAVCRVVYPASDSILQVVAPLSSSVEAVASSGVEGIGHLYSQYSPRVSGGNPELAPTGLMLILFSACL